MGIEDFETESEPRDPNPRNKKYSKHEIMGAFIELAVELGETPTMRQATSDDRLPSHRTICNHFAKYNKLVTACGLDTNQEFGVNHEKEQYTYNVYDTVEPADNDDLVLVKEHTSKSKGEATEAIVIAELMKRNITVTVPHGEDARYDMIADIAGDLYKLQCKTARISGGTLQFNTQSSSMRRDGYKKVSYGDEIDYFIVYSWDLDEVFIIHQSDVGNKTGSLRLHEPENNQTTGVKFAHDYSLDVQLANI